MQKESRHQQKKSKRKQVCKLENESFEITWLKQKKEK